MILFNFSLKRIPDYFIANYYAPICGLGILGLITFVLPPDVPDRPMFVVTTLLAIIFSQTSILGEIPKTSQRVLLGDVVQYMALLTAAITAYHTIICWLANISPRQDHQENHKKTLKRKGFIQRLFSSKLRAADCICFAASLVGFGVINLPIITAILRN